MDRIVTLHKRSHAGNDLTWSIYRQDKTLHIEYNALRTQIHHDCPEDAEVDMQRRIDHRLTRKGWTIEPQSIQQKRPMLARDYVPGSLHPTLSVICSPKLDGVRAYWDGKQLLSRTDVPFTSVPHIVKALEHFPPGLDGEIYHPTLDLEDIVSGSRVQKPDGLSLQLQFHVFDIMSNESSYARMLNLSQLKFNEPLFQVPHIITEVSQLPPFFDQFIASGYEGLVFRVFTESYQYDKRAMYRMKAIHRTKFVVKGVTDKPRTKGCAIFQFEGFEATINFPKPTQMYFFKNPQEVIGKEVLVEHRGFTSKGIPRNAKVVYI